MSDDPFAHLIPPLRRLMELRTAKDQADEAAKAAGKVYRDQQDKVHALMGSAGKQPVVDVDLGEPWGKVRFQRRETVYGKVYDHELAAKQAQEEGLFDDLTMPASHVKFREKALNDFVKERLEHGQPLPPGFEPSIRKFVSISRKK